MWYSYGVATETLAWLPGKQVTAMQLLNQFWYNKAVSRVQTRFKVAGEPIYFTCGNELKLYDLVSKKVFDIKSREF